ncbi:hypothetical protein [Bacillus sp. V2I10]|uniref:hypothetical protein n=1 Tax=Bacillus sp. V2I10 TaxID=3042276 RepID=UPI0027820113|nr:hypothetical protein [Bacillus sp. V2I10]MDQ0857532.1 putative transcriptional regulator [Bacillus sp. V2I10]
MLKLLVSSILVLMLSFQLLNYDVFARSQSNDKRMKLLNDKITKDIERSFPSLSNIKSEDNAYIFSYSDLIKMMISIGRNDTHLNSLISLFNGTSIGDSQLLIINDEYSHKWGNLLTGYIFYKETDGTNVLIKIKRGSNKW